MSVYNEVSNTSSLLGSTDWDTHFPERFSRMSLYDASESPVRSQRRLRNRNSNRYKTQPVTFDEIKEVDEEPVDNAKDDLKLQFAAFSRSMDGLMPGRTDDSDGQFLHSPHNENDTHSASSSKENLSLTKDSSVTIDTGDGQPPIRIPLGLTKHESYRRRRSKRRPRKSIEEEPEIEQLEQVPVI